MIIICFYNSKPNTSEEAVQKWDVNNCTLPPFERSKLARELGLEVGICLARDIKLGTTFSARDDDFANLILEKRDAAWFGE